jgi:hypothetical protein
MNFQVSWCEMQSAGLLHSAQQSAQLWLCMQMASTYTYIAAILKCVTMVVAVVQGPAAIYTAPTPLKLSWKPTIMDLVLE